MSKWTPGPWAWGTDQGGNEQLTAPTGDVIHSAPYEGMWFCYENEKANMALIAAAPEMAELLQGIQDNRHKCSIDNYAPGLEGFDERLTALLERINK